MRKIIRYCKQCNAEYIGHKSRMYCSQECHDLNKGHEAWNKGMTGTKGKPRNGQEKICEVCNTPFYVPKVRIDAKYCSPECYRIGRWNGTRKITKTCPICQTPFETTTGVDQKTCGNPTCRNEQISIVVRGENNKFWRGGKMAPYVGEWNAQRRAARERDGYKCVLCGSLDRIQVHHIIPFRYSQSHELDNLVTLCRSCHSKEELKVNPFYAQTLENGRSIRLAFLAERKQSSNVL